MLKSQLSNEWRQMQIGGNVIWLAVSSAYAQNIDAPVTSAAVRGKVSGAACGALGKDD